MRLPAGGAELRLAWPGCKIGPGFLKAAAARVGGTHGCTHLRELLQQMGTTAFQTIKPAKARQAMLDEGTASPEPTATMRGWPRPWAARRRS